MLTLLLIVIALAVVLYLKQAPGKQVPQIPSDWKLLYADKGRRSKLYTSQEFGINAKPDFIFQLPSGENAIVEYKNRVSRVYSSDVQQVKASALAVRASIPLQRGFVLTKQGLQEIPLASDNQALYSQIEPYVKLARDIKYRKVMVMAGCNNPRQCINCSFRPGCQVRG